MRPLLIAYLTSLAVLAAVVIAGAAVILSDDGSADPAEAAAERHGFDLLDWEVKHLPEKWLYKIGDAIVGHDKGQPDEDVIERYFNLVDEIARLEAEDPDSADLADAEDERAWLENTVEDIIEGRVTAVLRDEGLVMNPPLFTEADLLFPPVDFELDAPPRVLAVSPRDRLELRDDYLLQSGIPRREWDEIEAQAEDDGDVAALVVQAGGVATYPSIINSGRDYERIVDTVFHEWLHQYLVFYPLGSRYFQGSELRTLNESVASIGGRELARIYFERYGEPDPPQDGPPATAAPEDEVPPDDEEPFDFTAEMRALRVQVERLLAGGQIDEAETLMAQKRDEFEGKGVFIRRLNQAYFAFYGFYADAPGSIDPIGPKLETALEDAESPGEFIRRVRSVTSEADLDELVAGESEG